MSDMIELPDLRLTSDRVAAFARWSGDQNDLHMNEAFARRGRFRGRVAHGMLMIGMLSALCARWPDKRLRLTTISGQFLRPIAVDDSVDLRIWLTGMVDGEHAFRAEWTRSEDGELACRAQGSFLVLMCSGSTTGAAATPASLPSYVQCDRDLDALAKRSESVSWMGDAMHWRQLADTVLVPMGVAATGEVPCLELEATLMLSALVGMRLPGRRAIFLRFSLRFHEECVCGERLTITGRVSRLVPVAGLVKADIAVRQGHRDIAMGELEALVSEPPARMPACSELRAESLDLGLTGRVALIVGGSRGIGETSAKLLAMLGARVWLTYFHGEADAAAIVADIRDNGGEAEAIACDIRDENAVEAVVRAIIAREDRIDILANCAVHAFTPGSFTSLSWASYQDELDVSLRGLHAACRQVVPFMRRSGGGKIINFSSVVVRMPVSGQSRYITAKAAVEGYTRALAVETAAHNIQVNLLAPTMVETDLVASIPASYRQRLHAERAGGRQVRPVDVARALAFLASAWSGALTGQTLTLNAGGPPFT